MHVLLLLLCASALWSQVRLAILPFRNMDGDLRYNLWCYRFADSVAMLLMQADTVQRCYRI
ncbi:MAG: hypothetical protein NZ949_07630, partial [Candidatus Kapabacteria bacterium]|nr:hypothetical protein [Candidatus Kapabacteria bacterium]